MRHADALMVTTVVLLTATSCLSHRNLSSSEGMGRKPVMSYRLDERQFVPHLDMIQAGWTKEQVIAHAGPPDRVVESKGPEMTIFVYEQVFRRSGEPDCPNTELITFNRKGLVDASRRKFDRAIWK